MCFDIKPIELLETPKAEQTKTENLELKNIKKVVDKTEITDIIYYRRFIWCGCESRKNCSDGRKVKS